MRIDAPVRAHGRERIHTRARERSPQGGLTDLVAFGQLFLANPDLVERFRRGTKLNAPDPATFYGGDAKGYIDYPTLEQTAEV